MDRSRGAIGYQMPFMAGLICKNHTRLCHNAVGAEWMRVQNVGGNWSDWLPFVAESVWASVEEVPVLVQYHAAASASFVVGDCMGAGGKGCWASWHRSMRLSGAESGAICVSRFLRGEWNSWGEDHNGAMAKIGHFTWAANVSLTKFTKSKFAPYPGHSLDS